MKDIVFRELLTPLASRLGTMAAGATWAYMPAGQNGETEFAKAVAIIALVAVDLVIGKLLRKTEGRK
ncbi:hypothetical protein BA190_07575 [Labrys sp. WJW]|uniref:hypothetical protein n=1 Tax=Labrys sp. WJW TaxID=1737983 RepID=UPI00082C7DBC|nr:hypothetical protein [Labrys sp. WJW]OCC05616.1 hypothetical protein BA190_07575 [Labrys sp. WJW]